MNITQTDDQRYSVMKATHGDPSETYSEKRRKVTLSVRGKSWYGGVSTYTYGISEKEIPKSLSLVKRFTKDLEEVYYAEVIVEEHTKTVTTVRID